LRVSADYGAAAGPDGCPWDREQTFETIKKYTLEETYEVFDAIERRDFPHLAEELGDLLLQVIFYAEMAANQGEFTIADVLDHLNRKLVRRHPHVLGKKPQGQRATRPTWTRRWRMQRMERLRQCCGNWEEIKLARRSRRCATTANKTSRLDGVLRGIPALSEAAKLGAKAQKAGFDWQSWRDLLPKVAEEVAELEAEAASDDPARKVLVEAELGDLLFTVVNLGRHLGVDAEMALRGCNLRFRERFREMEIASEKPLEELELDELEALWSAAKKSWAIRMICAVGRRGWLNERLFDLEQDAKPTSSPLRFAPAKVWTSWRRAFNCRWKHGAMTRAM